jgi:hypothetical protein
MVSNLAADSPARLILEIDIGELQAVVVAHDKAGGVFLRKRRSVGIGWENFEGQVMIMK